MENKTDHQIIKEVSPEIGYVNIDEVIKDAIILTRESERQKSEEKMEKLRLENQALKLLCEGKDLSKAEKDEEIKRLKDWNYLYIKNQEKIWNHIKRDLDTWKKSQKDPIAALTDGLGRWIALVIQEEKKKLVQEIFNEIEQMLLRISYYHSEVNDFVNIGRQNSLGDINNEIDEIRKRFLGEKDG